MMQHFCTYFDINYIHRGLALYRSLEQHCEDFILWILCFDDETYRILDLLNLEKARLVRRQDFELGDEALAAAQQDRSMVEYYWTCTPSLPLYIFRCHSNIETIFYVDADIFFFSSPQPIFDKFGTNSIFIIPHDYDVAKYNFSQAGTFNVGILGFRSDEAGYKCLRTWRENCNSWCRHENRDGKFADQGYLDAWPHQFESLVVSTHPGIHAAPWNISKYDLSLTDKKQLSVNGYPLISYHFHALNMIGKRTALIHEGHTFMSRLIREYIYRPYVHMLCNTLEQLESVGYFSTFKLSGSTLFFLAKRLFIHRTLAMNVIRV